MLPMLPIPHSIDLGGAPRVAGRLDDLATPERDLPSIQVDIAAAPVGGRWLLRGGEPTTRADLLSVIRVAAAANPERAWLRTDGLALVSPSACAALVRAGLSGVRVPMHSGRADGHDWLVGQPGAARRVARAIRAAVTAGLTVEVEVALTRPTTPYLAETVALALKLGARGIWIRRVRAIGPAAKQLIALAARLGELRTPVEEAVRIAEDGGASIWVEGLPRCVVPGAEANLCTDGTPTAPCTACPGLPACVGVPTEYTDRFGWAEIWRLTPREQREEVSVIVDPTEPTRALRLRMLRAAQLRPQRLCLIDIAAHPEALSLLRDALRLSVPEVEVSGRIDRLAELPDTALFRLRGLARVDAVATRPEEVAALRASLARLHRDVQTSVVGLASEPGQVAAFEAAGVDEVRLSGTDRGDCLTVGDGPGRV
ncbi:MAG: hypothetical protein ACI8S6_003448 [Myxococcota bacterium]|jgi:hypothetical protein